MLVTFPDTRTTQNYRARRMDAVATSPAGEASRWMRVTRIAAALAARGSMPEPYELGIVGGFDPTRALVSTMEKWDYRPRTLLLPELSRFGGYLAAISADASMSGDETVARRARIARRRLLADRVVHWAVPWLDAIVRSEPEVAASAREARDLLLGLAETHQAAPVPEGSEGLLVPGFDGYGPIHTDLGDSLATLRCGDVLGEPVLESIGLGLTGYTIPLTPHQALALGRHFLTVQQRWDYLAGRAPGSSQYWRDLAGRARLTAQRVLRSGRPALTPR